MTGLFCIHAFTHSVRTPGQGAWHRIADHTLTMKAIPYHFLNADLPPSVFESRAETAARRRTHLIPLYMVPLIWIRSRAKGEETAILVTRVAQQCTRQIRTETKFIVAVYPKWGVFLLNVLKRAKRGYKQSRRNDHSML